MQELPLVSVVTCSYNNARFIIDTLNSIKDQTYSNIELVIVEDCSTDNSLQLIEEWLKSYTGKYKLIKHKFNKGGALPYNAGIEAATGKYYVAVDSDDVLMPEKIERQVHVLEAAGENVAAVYSDAYVIDVNSKQLEGFFIQRHRQFTEMPSGNIYKQLLRGNYIPLMSLLVKREVFQELGTYDEHLVYGDFDMWLRIAKKYEFIYSDYISGKYRIRPGSLSFTIKNWDYSNVKIFLKHVDSPLDFAWINKIARHAYTTYDSKTMLLIKELAVKTGDRRLMATYLVAKFDFAPSIGTLVLDAVYDHIAAGLSPVLLITDDTDINIFLNEIVYSIPVDLMKKVAIDAYKNNRKDTYELLDALADKMDSWYFKTACLLGNLRVPFEKGQLILSRIKNEVPYYQHKGKEGIDEKGMSTLHGDIVSLLSFSELQKIAYESYLQDSKEMRPFFYDLAEKTGDRYITAVGLLWKEEVPVSVGKQMLGSLQKSIEAGAPAKIMNKYDSDSALLLKEIIPHIPVEAVRKFARDTYETNIEKMLFINKIAQKTNDKYLRIVCMLGRLKVSSRIGRGILASIEMENEKRLPDRTIMAEGDDTHIFMNEVAPLLSNDMLKKFAREAYFDNNVLLIPIVKRIAQKTGSTYIKAILKLWTFKVNTYTGKIILERVEGYCNARLNDAYISLCVYKDIYGAFRSSNSYLFNKNNM
jgi:glycosyltransferase involved in cell wall biosynthesis